MVSPIKKRRSVMSRRRAGLRDSPPAGRSWPQIWPSRGAWRRFVITNELVRGGYPAADQEESGGTGHLAWPAARIRRSREASKDGGGSKVWRRAEVDGLEDAD